MISVRQVVLLVVFVAASSVQCRMVDIVRGDVTSADMGWDSLIFAVQWPVTSCLMWKEARHDHTCILPEKHIWTVHGIWPTKAGTQGPAFCNRTWEFDVAKLGTLRPELQLVWPNIHGNDTEDSLWRHEWDKHGTCAALDDKFSSEPLYFNQGVQWVKLYKMTEILKKANILPSISTKYNATSITHVVKDAIGAMPSIGCQFDRDNGLSYLSEIRLCFRRDLTLTDCDHHQALDMLTTVGDCPTHKSITYPGKSSIFRLNSSSAAGNKKRQRKKQMSMRKSTLNPGFTAI